jgi:hypothetical protein
VQARHLARQIRGQWEQTPPAFEIGLQPRKQRGEKQGIFDIHVWNQSAVDLTVDLEAADAKGACTYTLEHSTVTVPAGKMRSVPLEVKPKVARPLLEVTVHTFTVTATSTGTPGLSHQVQGQWEQIVAAPPPAPAEPGPRTFLAIVTVLVGIVLSFLLGAHAYDFAYYAIDFDDSGATVSSLVAGIAGFALTLVAAGKISRRQPIKGCLLVLLIGFVIVGVLSAFILNAGGW